MILLVSTCAEPLHELEFVRPIQQILEKEGHATRVEHYHKLPEQSIGEATHIIICGTSLKDDAFLDDLEKFSWIKKVSVPILGICAGMQLIALQFGAELKEKQEIGLFAEEFAEFFFGLEGKEEVYHLHHHYCTLPEGFTQHAGTIPQAIKHQQLPIYGLLFHPEVRQGRIITAFSSLS